MIDSEYSSYYRSFLYLHLSVCYIAYFYLVHYSLKEYNLFIFFVDAGCSFSFVSTKENRTKRKNANTLRSYSALSFS